MAKSWAHSALCLGLVFISSCANNNFSPYSKLKGLRIVAIKAAQPELDLGGSTALETLVSWTDKDAQTLTHEAVACLDPGVSFGADATCEGSTSKQTLVASGSLVLTAPHFTDVVSLGTLNVASFLNSTVFASYPDSSRYNGVSILVVYKVSASDGTLVTASKSILVSDASKTTKNANPSIPALALDAATLSQFPTTKGTISATTVSNEASDAYVVKNSDGTLIPFKEELLLTWFLSEGSIKRTHTIGSDENTFTPEATDTAKPTKTLVVVVRDGRGGIDYLVRTTP